MMTIWKYEVNFDTNEMAIDMPKGAQILAVQTQENRGVFWALVDTEAALETRNFVAQLTGESLTLQYPSELKYIGTFQTLTDQYIDAVIARPIIHSWHLFEVK